MANFHLKVKSFKYHVFIKHYCCFGFILFESWLFQTFPGFSRTCKDSSDDKIKLKSWFETQTEVGLTPETVRHSRWLVDLLVLSRDVLKSVEVVTFEDRRAAAARHRQTSACPFTVDSHVLQSAHCKKWLNSTCLWDSDSVKLNHKLSL